MFLHDLFKKQVPIYLYKKIKEIVVFFSKLQKYLCLLPGATLNIPHRNFGLTYLLRSNGSVLDVTYFQTKLFSVAI